MLQQLRKHSRGGGSNGNIGVKIVNTCKIEIKILSIYTYDLQKNWVCANGRRQFIFITAVRQKNEIFSPAVLKEPIIVQKLYLKRKP